MLARKVWTLACLILNGCASMTLGLNNGLAMTPPMGWMSGQRYGCQADCVNYPDDCISERLMKSTVDMMVTQHYVAAGYEYLVLDDGWMAATRDNNGRLQADPKRFPSGIQDLVAYVHSNGLKIGLYLDIGNATCCGGPGSWNNYALDAWTVASWQVDMVKVGACGSPQDVNSINWGFPALGQALSEVGGNPILYLCEWPAVLYSKGTQANFQYVAQVCNQYRSFTNIADDWQYILNEIQYYAGYNYLFANHSGPGSFNDPDQLVIGDFGLSMDQERFQLALWAILSAPLFISADLRFIDTESQDLLLNPLAISIDQDPLGVFGQQIQVNGQVSIWRKSILPTGSYALAIFYTQISGGASMLNIVLSDVGIVGYPLYNITEVLSGTYMGTFKPWYTLNCAVNPTGALLFQAIALPSDMALSYNYDSVKG